jgi:hypothetical protein
MSWQSQSECVNASQQPPRGKKKLIFFASSKLATEALVPKQAILS